jgi:hypothetical protein
MPPEQEAPQVAWAAPVHISFAIGMAKHKSPQGQREPSSQYSPSRHDPSGQLPQT